MENNHVVLVMGRPNSGKSFSLKDLPNQEKYVYLNCDLKELPFKHNFEEARVTDPVDIIGYIQEINSSGAIEGAIIDTCTFLMDMYEQQYVVTSTNTQKALNPSAFY